MAPAMQIALAKEHMHTGRNVDKHLCHTKVDKTDAAIKYCFADNTGSHVKRCKWHDQKIKMLLPHRAAALLFGVRRTRPICNA